MKFHDVTAGQKVRAVDSACLPSMRGLTGIVRGLDWGEFVGVEFFGFTEGHRLFLMGDPSSHLLPHGSKSGYWIQASDLELIESTQSHTLLPSEAADRKKIPLASGVLDYFTAALVAVAQVSQSGNDQHNPGQPMQWARGKSTDQSDTLMRHFIERGTIDTDGMRHSAKMAWRALAILQLELEADGAPVARGARFPEEKK